MDAPENSAPVIFELRPCVSSSARVTGGRRTIVLHNEETHKFYHLGVEESVVVSLLDGVLTVQEIHARLKSLQYRWEETDLQRFMTVLLKADLIALAGPQGIPVTPDRESAQPPKTPIQYLATSLGWMMSQRLSLGSGDTVATRVLPVLSWMFQPRGVVLWASLVMFCFWIAVENRLELAQQCRQVFAPHLWPFLALVGVLLKAIHEVGHAVSAKRHGVQVGRFGITVFLFAPIAYVDVTGAWKLPKRWQRIQIAIGGVYVESWLAIAGTCMFAVLPDGLMRHLCVQVMLLAGPASWLLNANPLMRLDGYYALSDLVEIPNLRMHGRKQWSALLDRFVFRIPLTPSLLTGWRLHFAVWHAAASMVFQVVWMTGLIIAVSSWASLAGKILTVVVCISWLVLPAVQWCMAKWNYGEPDSSERKRYRTRLTAFASTTLFILSCVLSARNPFAHGVPAVVQHRAEQVGRSPTDGFVIGVFVQSNQIVSRGDLLMEIHDESLQLRRDQMQDELQMVLVKYQQQQVGGRLGDAEASLQTANQLRESLAELDAALDGSRIVATRDGIVVSEQPEKWLGRYAKRGEVLVRVADPHDKELLVAIKEDDHASYNQSVARGRPFLARLRGGTRLTVEPAAAHPRFMDTFPHPAFSADQGGEIPFISDAEAPDGVRPAIPLGQAVAMIPPAQSLIVRAGQRGILYLDDDQTIYGRLKRILLADQ